MGQLRGAIVTRYKSDVHYWEVWNEPDLAELPAEVKADMTFVPVKTLEEVLKNVKMAGIPILLVEQNYHLAMRLADYVYVFSQGRVQFSGETQALVANENIRRTYLSV